MSKFFLRAAARHPCALHLRMKIPLSLVALAALVLLETLHVLPAIASIPAVVFACILAVQALRQ